MRASHRLLIVALMGLGCLSPVPARAWALVEDRLEQAEWAEAAHPVPALTHGDLDGDGLIESLSVESGIASIRKDKETIWQSPTGWEVHQAALTDLNRDGRLEAVLLVWRKFKPWPIDRFIPNPGRISEFQDSRGNSCSIILVGWRQGAFREAWAGSALAEPVKSFVTADLNADGAAELVTLDARYDDPGSRLARSLSVWEWNGFGFTLVARQKGAFRALLAGRTPSGLRLLMVGK